MQRDGTGAVEGLGTGTLCAMGNLARNFVRHARNIGPSPPHTDCLCYTIALHSSYAPPHQSEGRLCLQGRAGLGGQLRTAHRLSQRDAGRGAAQSGHRGADSQSLQPARKPRRQAHHRRCKGPRCRRPRLSDRDPVAGLPGPHRAHPLRLGRPLSPATAARPRLSHPQTGSGFSPTTLSVHCGSGFSPTSPSVQCGSGFSPTSLSVHCGSGFSPTKTPRNGDTPRSD